MHFLTFGLNADLVNGLLGILIAAAAAVIRHSIKTPRDAERAQLLSTLANDAAAVVINLNPKAPWTTLVRDVIAKLASQSTVPTTNAQKLEQAAVAALVRLGVTAGK